MRGRLACQALLRWALGVAVVALLLFVPAGTWMYPHGWLLMGLLFVPMLGIGVVLAIRNPALLQKRLDAREQASIQRRVIRLSSAMFAAGFVLCGLNARFAWSTLPNGVIAAASGVFLLGYGMYAEVLRGNAYLSRTITVQTGQRVVDSGLYGVIRHPMYAATICMFLAMPLVLNAWPALAVFGLYPLLIVRRIRHEESVLAEELAGYRAYQQKVRYRLIPWVW